jgi:hypothetical protein
MLRTMVGLPPTENSCSVTTELVTLQRPAAHQDFGPELLRAIEDGHRSAQD